MHVLCSRKSSTLSEQVYFFCAIQIIFEHCCTATNRKVEERRGKFFGPIIGRRLFESLIINCMRRSVFEVTPDYGRLQ